MESCPVLSVFSFLPWPVPPTVMAGKYAGRSPDLLLHSSVSVPTFANCTIHTSVSTNKVGLWNRPNAMDGWQKEPRPQHVGTKVPNPEELRLASGAVLMYDGQELASVHPPRCEGVRARATRPGEGGGRNERKKDTTRPCSALAGWLAWRDCGRCALRRSTLSQPRRRHHDSLRGAPVLLSWPDWASLLPAWPAPYHRRSEMGGLGTFRSSEMPVLVTLSCMNMTGGPTRCSPGLWSQQAQRPGEP